MNILVTGANGQLGNHVRLLATRSENRYFFTDVEELDITNRERVMAYVAENDIQCIINCAAYTNVDMAEDDEDKAELINATSVGHLSEAMQTRGGFLIHCSTDYVFGGNKNNTPCKEDEKVNPTGAYGRTKLHGEKTVIQSGCQYIIIRTSWLYSEYGKNFLKTMMRVQSEREECKVVFDQVGTPTYAGDLAKAIFAIVEQNKMIGNEGIYHFSNEGVCSWFDFATIIGQLIGSRCRVLPCHSDEFPSKVVRPSYSVLDKTRIKNTFGIEIPYWVDSLRQCINNIKD